MAGSMALFDDSESDLSSARSLSPPTSGSSSPLSPLENSPTPPPELRKREYPLSPPDSSQETECDSPTPDGMDSRDGQPPAKRRRVSKDSSIEYLDLSSADVADDEQVQYRRLMRVLHKRRKIVVIAGAGISASAGIPVFRSTTGIFSSLKTEHKLKGSGKDLFDASVYNEPESTTAFHSMIRDMSQLTKVAKPTNFHHMLASLAQQGRLLRLYTQNVDGIDVSLQPLKTMVPLKKRPDGKWPQTIQLHGGLEKMVCSKCHELKDLDSAIFEGPTAPPCPTCIELDDTRQTAGKRSHGIGRLRPRMVLYSERNPDDEAIGTVARHDLRRRPDAVIVVGTTLKVPGVCRIVKEMCGVVQDHRDGVSIWINNDPPPGGQFEDCFDLVVSGPADAVAAHAKLPRWDEPVSEASSLPASSRTSPIPPTLNRIKLPSPEHFNNSFKVPSSSFSYDDEPTAPSFSPLKRQAGYVHGSIESDDTIAVRTPPTPTKSIKGTPLKKNIYKDLLNAKTAAAKSNGKPKTAKVSKSQKAKKTTGKKATKPQPSLKTMNATFKTAKAMTMPMSKHLNDIGDTIAVSPNKAMRITSILNPASPAKSARSSPMKPIKPVAFPNLARGISEN